MDSLPRWRILQAAGYSEYDFVLVPSPSSPFEKEVLDLLEIPPAKRLHCSKNFVHQFERLVVPAMPFPVWQVSTWASAWVRSLFQTDGAGPEKIYISRRNAPCRRLVNEVELETQLQAAGFVSIRAEQFSVAEQARLFGSAKYVVASHGAGLANMAFAPANALLVELFHPDYIRPAYENLAAAAGLRYIATAGSSRNNPGTSRRKQSDFNFEIDVSAVARAITENEARLTHESGTAAARRETGLPELLAT
jgi:capsular polysaccharide biosynthesis protein